MRLFVPIARDEFDVLLALARAERRRPQQQAALLLSRALSSLVPSPNAVEQPMDAGVPTRWTREERG